LKFMKADATEGRAARRRFLREAQAVSAISHPNVVVIHDVLELDTGPVLVMERLFGETLKQRLARESPLDDATTRAIMLQVTRGVRAAHARGVLHRDLKPDNIFLCSDRGDAAVRVLDFGLAKLSTSLPLDSLAGDLTESGAMLGTPYYMSPEQAFGERDIDERADVWSLGVILYQCLSGVRPTEAANIGQILKRVMKNDIAPLQAVAPDVSPTLASLVMKMLGDRAERPALAEVESVLASRPTVAAPERSPADSVASIGLSGAPRPRESQRPLPRIRRAALIWLAAGLIVGGTLASLRSWGTNAARAEGARARVRISAKAAGSTADANAENQPPTAAVPAARAEQPEVVGAPSAALVDAGKRSVRRTVARSTLAVRDAKAEANVELFDDPM